MRENQRLVVLSRLARELEAHGSWGGETHLQKAVYMLQELTRVPLRYPFMLYLHGPFSFELREELNRMRADDLLELVVQPYPYGPSFRATDSAEQLEAHFPHTLGRYDLQIKFVTELVGSRSASDLERLGTAFYLIEKAPRANLPELAKEFNDLKPHVSLDSALRALEEIKEAVDSAPIVTVESVDA